MVDNGRNRPETLSINSDIVRRLEIRCRARSATPRTTSARHLQRHLRYGRADGVQRLSLDSKLTVCRGRDVSEAQGCRTPMATAYRIRWRTLTSSTRPGLFRCGEWPVASRSQIDGRQLETPDMFVEIGFMFTDATHDPWPAASGVGLHSHLPSAKALEMVGGRTKKAPIANPDGTTGINAHFDIGAIRPQTFPSKASCENPATWTLGCVIVPGALAHGGEAIVEEACGAGGQSNCRFPNHPGTVGWKSGFQYHRDARFVHRDSGSVLPKCRPAKRWEIVRPGFASMRIAWTSSTTRCGRTRWVFRKIPVSIPTEVQTSRVSRRILISTYRPGAPVSAMFAVAIW